jgi:hypothetical protein
MHSIRIWAVQLMARIFSVPITVRCEFYGARIGCSEVVFEPRLTLPAETAPGCWSTVGDDQ